MSSQPASIQPSRKDIETAHDRIRSAIHRTPVLTSTYFNQRLGAEIFFKCENFQKIGAFKFRGAYNAISTLGEDELARGVVTHSSGNHAQAVALAARLMGTKAYIVMPDNASSVKVEAVRGYGAEIFLCEPTQVARGEGAEKLIEETGATMIHPFNDLRIIAGQATSAKELIEDVPDLDAIMAPVGGGGLLSGTALSARYFSPARVSPGIKVFGGEPKLADDAWRSLQSGKMEPACEPKTIADGLLTSLGELTYAVIRSEVEAIHTVAEDEIVEAMRLVWERMKIVIEPSSAVPLAALLSGRMNNEDWTTHGKRIGVIFSGGNVDLRKLPWLAGSAGGA